MTSLAFSPSGQLACGGGRTWSQDGQVIVWDLSGATPKRIRQRECPETVRGLAYSLDGKWLAITHEFSAGIVHVIDATTLEKVFELQSHAGKVTTLTFTPDSSRLITGSDDGTVRFWELRHGKSVGTLQVGARVRNLAMLPDGNTLITLSLDGWLRQWRASP